jgi:hypothetical protein
MVTAPDEDLLGLRPSAVSASAISSAVRAAVLSTARGGFNSYMAYLFERKEEMMLDIKGLDVDIKVPHPKATGELTQSAVTTELLKQNIPVSLPVGDNQRYDLIFEAKDKLWKAQVKTLYCSKRDNAYMFNTTSVRINSVGYVRTNYVNQIDVFLVWGLDFPLDLYIIPVEFASNGGSMRLCMQKPTRKIKHNWHEDYYFSKWLKI